MHGEWGVHDRGACVAKGACVARKDVCGKGPCVVKAGVCSRSKNSATNQGPGLPSRDYGDSHNVTGIPT